MHDVGFDGDNDAMLNVCVVGIVAVVTAGGCRQCAVLITPLDTRLL